MLTPPSAAHDDAATRTAIAALAALLVLDFAMFTSMLAGVAPHPPGERGPFIAGTAALALATLLQVSARQRSGGVLAVLTALAFFPAVGPHKFFTEAAARELAPVILVGTAALVTLALAGFRLLRHDRAAPARQGAARAAATP